ncbi:hypothetical protein AXP62_24320 [Salmonella enterica subsp. enterica]|nr:hypothetical protein [Salmonella enterica subsp. enterica]
MSKFYSCLLFPEVVLQTINKTLSPVSGGHLLTPGPESAVQQMVTQVFSCLYFFKNLIFYF